MKMKAFWTPIPLFFPNCTQLDALVSNLVELIPLLNIIGAQLGGTCEFPGPKARALAKHARYTAPLHGARCGAHFGVYMSGATPSGFLASGSYHLKTAWPGSNQALVQPLALAKRHGNCEEQIVELATGEDRQSLGRPFTARRRGRSKRISTERDCLP